MADIPRIKFSQQRRNRNPPVDPVNSMLSYGYTLLYYNLCSLVRVRGLNPHVGFLHPVRSGHPALVSDDKIRRQVANCLQNYGQRVQYSIFECHVTEREFKRLRGTIAGKIDKEDSVRWYPVCRWCRQKIGRQGVGRLTDDPEYFRV